MDIDFLRIDNVSVENLSCKKDQLEVGIKEVVNLATEASQRAVKAEQKNTLSIPSPTISCPSHALARVVTSPDKCKLSIVQSLNTKEISV